ncbi:hypothetical protein [Burkholderia metallica]|uniref:hypothetical protein n=1 Tax=Burkholderia metallica TaxID=488729 RepID=UPI0030011A25
MPAFDATAVRFCLCKPHVDRHAAALRKLDRIANDFQDQLPHPGRIAQITVGEILRNTARQREAFRIRERVKNRSDVAYNTPQVKRGASQHHPVRL